MQGKELMERHKAVNLLHEALSPAALVNVRVQLCQGDSRTDGHPVKLRVLASEHEGNLKRVLVSQHVLVKQLSVAVEEK